MGGANPATHKGKPIPTKRSHPSTSKNIQPIEAIEPLKQQSPEI